MEVKLPVAAQHSLFRLCHPFLSNGWHFPEVGVCRRRRKTFPLPEHIQHDEHLPEDNDQFTPVKNLKL